MFDIYLTGFVLTIFFMIEFNDDYKWYEHLILCLFWFVTIPMWFAQIIKKIREMDKKLEDK